MASPDEIGRAMNVRDTVVAALFVFVVVWATIGFVANRNRANEIKGVASANRHLVACLSIWADKTSGRMSTLTPLANRRGDALDRVIRDVGEPEFKPDQFQRHIRIYVAASDAYNRAAERHPVPMAPKLRC